LVRPLTGQKLNFDVSVYIGNHVAIPHGIHGSENEIIKSGLSLIQLPEGVSFGENKIAYVVIGIAGKGNEHMNYLQKIALICSEIDNVEKIRNATTKQEILKLFENN
jgi:mannitol/fructose-specific phosphotransferase system IIA component